MRYSNLFPKTLSGDTNEETAINAKLLTKAGFIDKLMSGSYSILPLGQRVKTKIENIIRIEMNKINAQEALMPLLHPKSIWNETGRWESAKAVMYQFAVDQKEYALSFTHEEIVLDLARKHITSYRDLPIKIYHFSTKFRQELRAKSGLLRCREFIMKDLYSLHTSQEELDNYYWQVSEAYKKIFGALELDIHVVEAAGGVFTNNLTHEFQVVCPTGEDTIFYCDSCDFAQNKEIYNLKKIEACPKCQGSIKSSSSIEIGNIFRFGTSYSKKMNVSFVSEKGERKSAYLGSYGIGVTRLMGTLAEIKNDKAGLIWPRLASPFQVHLINLDDNAKFADLVYRTLIKSNIDVLYENRINVSAGEKFATADLIGIPIRLVISKKTGERVELKKRNEEKFKLFTVNEIINQINDFYLQ